jgi:hypothetical protein
MVDLATVMYVVRVSAFCSRWGGGGIGCESADIGDDEDN